MIPTAVQCRCHKQIDKRRGSWQTLSAYAVNYGFPRGGLQFCVILARRDIWSLRPACRETGGASVHGWR